MNYFQRQLSYFEFKPDKGSNKKDHNIQLPFRLGRSFQLYANNDNAIEILGTDEE